MSFNILSLEKIMNKLENVILRYFFIGNIKYAPGSFASFVALIIYFFIPNTIFYQLFFLTLHLVLGFYFCFLYSQKNQQNEDPGFIVIDEVVGMFISLLFIPKVLSAYLLSFILFRFFDIVKPSIIYRIQNMRYGFGIMLDDILSGIITLLIVTGLLL